MAHLKLLVIAQFSPPSSEVAARRVGGLTKYLGRLGHEVTVLTSMASGSGPVEGAARTVRTRDLLTSRINWRRGQIESLKGQSADTYGAASPLASLVVPDLSLVGWLPFAVARALALERDDRPDAVLTTSPPESVHLAGFALSSRGLPWIADFRDGWNFERATMRRWPHPVQQRIDDALEAAVARRASLAVGVTEPIATDLRDRLGTTAVTVTNGFDPELAGDWREEHPLVSPDRHTLVHTGRMAVMGRSPRPLLDAVLGAEDLHDRLEVVFAGALTAEERELIEAPALEGIVRWAGSVEPEESLRLQRAADSLLLFPEAARQGHVPGKLYEYLATGKPILAVGTGVSADMAAEAGVGASAPADDRAGIAVALRELVERPRGNGRRPESVERFAYPRLAERYAEQIELVVARGR